MDPIIIDNITFNPDFEAISDNLKIKPGSSRAAEINNLLTKAREIARPKAVYKIVSVQGKGEDQITLDGKLFASRILCINLEDVHRAFLYVVTCGTELHEWVKEIKDPFTSYLADSISLFALYQAEDHIFSHLSDNYGLTKTATMNPGSLEDWPIQAQIPLFELLGDPRKAIGVYLTESLLMIPRQSVSGIL